MPLMMKPKSFKPKGRNVKDSAVETGGVVLLSTGATHTHTHARAHARTQAGSVTKRIHSPQKLQDCLKNLKLTTIEN